MKQSARFRARNPGLIRHVAERAVAIIVVENIAAILSNEKIRKAIVVIVAPDAAEPVAGSGYAGFVGNVAERAIAVVAIRRITN